MKNFILVILLFISNYFISQEDRDCTCLENLEETSQLIKKSVSYKSQVKSLNKEREFYNWKKYIEAEIKADSLSKYFCIGYLQKYISFIKDTHNQIYNTNKNISSIIPMYPNIIDSKLNLKDSISGIYYQGTDKIKIIKETDNLWYGVLLDTKSENWKKGMIKLRIRKHDNDLFEIYEFYSNGFLYYQPYVNIKNGRIHSTFWNKTEKYYFNKNHRDNFDFKRLNESFNYVSIKSLSRTNQLIKEAKTFYNSIENKLNSKNLIIDLRNNGGGSFKQLNQLSKLIKKNKTIGKIFVLVNFKTASASELGAYELNKDPRVIIAGENTRGMLTYGYGNKAISGTLNCGKIKYTFSKKVTNENFLQYEGNGLIPELYLENNKDWVEQILELDN